MNRKSAFVLFCVLLAAGTARAAAAQESREPAQSPTPEVVAEAVTLPAGTLIPIVLGDYLSTRNSQAGDVFYADTTYPIWLGQKLIIPKGSNLRGTVTEVTRPGRIKGKGRLAIRFDDILLPNGVKQPLIATFRGIHGPGDETLDRGAESVEGGGSSATEDVGTVIGMTSQGALLGTLGGVIGGNAGKGIGIGGGIGAAVGIAQVLFSRGRDLVINPGTRFDIELRQPMNFARNELEFSSAQLEDASRNTRQTPVSAPSSGGRNNRFPQGRGGVFGLPGGAF